jgi:hypothetical protein
MPLINHPSGYCTAIVTLTEVVIFALDESVPITVNV